MLYMIWLLLVCLTLSTWICSTLYVLYYKVDKSIHQPWPTAERDQEERFKVILLTWVYFPTLLAQLGWCIFSNSEKGSTIIKWLREKI